MDETNEAEVVTEEETNVDSETTATEGEENTEETQEEVKSAFSWYIAKSMSGQENKVAKAIKERVVNFKKTEFFEDILVPEETVVSHAGGKKRTIKKKLFPGYVLIKMIMNDDTWHLIKDTDKVMGFVGGTSKKPQPITDAEAAYMTNQAEEGFKKTKTVASFNEGDSVKVLEGPFASFVGVVEHVNDKGKVKVNVSIFGRPTPVELEFSQVERVTA